MSDLRPDNGNEPPPDDRGRGLSGLPPEWGTIVIPDDPSELADEADQVRRELRRGTRRHRAPHLARPGWLRGSPSAIGIPLAIMALALFTTMISLLVVTWGNQPQAPLPSNRAPSSATASSPAGAATTPVRPDLQTPLANLHLVRSGGEQVRLGDVLPAVVLLVNGCACDPLVSSVAAAVPQGVHVVEVGSTTPPATSGPPTTTSPTAAETVVRVADPAGTLHARYFAKAAKGGSSASALVVNRSAKVVATIPQATRASDIPVPVG